MFEAHLANMDEEAGDLSGAEQRLERALTVHHEIGDVAWEGIVYGLLGNVRLRRRRFREAASAYREAAAKRFDINNVSGLRAQDLKIKRDGSVTTVRAVYEVRRPLVANLDIVASFDKSVELDSR